MPESIQAGPSGDGERCRRTSPGNRYEWTGVAFQQKKVSGQIVFVFAMAVLVVVMILAAQYESWIDPIAVVTVVPLAVLGAIVGLVLRDMDNNLYTQAGWCFGRLVRQERHSGGGIRSEKGKPRGNQRWKLRSRERPSGSGRFL